MKFIALILALLVIQYGGPAQHLQRDEWFRTFIDKLSGSGLTPALALAMAVLTPCLLVSWTLGVSHGWLFGFFGLALSVLLLLYSFGRRDYESLVIRYRTYCREGDFQGAFMLAQQEFPSPSPESAPESAEECHRWIKQNLAYMGFERWFAVIFYFALFGAAGALAYRLSHLAGDFSEDGGIRRVQGKLLHIIDWIPARLLLFAFAVTGDYVGSREQLAASVQDLDSTAAEVIVDGAHAALGLKTTVHTEGGDVNAFAQISDWEVGQLHGLLARSAVAWVLVISLIVVFT